MSQFPPPPSGDQPQHPTGYSHQGLPPQFQQGPGPAAGMGKRLLAQIVDVLAIGIPLNAVVRLLLPQPEVSAFASDGEQLSAILSHPSTFLPGLLFLGYFIVAIALRGATVGKTLLKIKVVDAHGNVPGWGPALIRYAVVLAGNLLCGVGALLVYLSPLFDSSGRRQGWHDKAAKTFVVNA